MLGVNVFAAETDEEGRRLFTSLQQAFVNLRRGHPGQLPPPDDGFVERLTPADRRLLDEMLVVLGGRLARRRCGSGLEAIVARTGADELMLASQIYDHAARLRSYELAARQEFRSPLWAESPERSSSDKNFTTETRRDYGGSRRTASLWVTAHPHSLAVLREPPFFSVSPW